MTIRFRWYLAAMVSFPLISITIYLLWLWPTPGTSELAEFVPYLLSLLTGLPFFWIISRGRALRRAERMFVMPSNYGRLTA